MVRHPNVSDIALVGAGPTASSLLERLAANAPELAAGRRVRVHLVDPHVAGIGRVWRSDNHPGLWMNSMAEDVTMFTDASVQIEGPVRPGPSLLEWAQSIDDATLREFADPTLQAEIRAIHGMTFPSRRVQSAYLAWYHQRVIDELPDELDVVTYRRRAVDLVDLPDGRQQITLEGGGDPIVADVVVLALGHLDSTAEPDAVRLAAFATEHGLTHVAAGHTAELDLSVLSPGEQVLVSGFGQAFTDLVVLLTEGRGGRFVPTDDGRLRYEPSGLEPVLHVGSRRGVPYRSKLDYRLQAPLAPLPHFLDDAAIARVAASPEPLEFRRDVLPLLEQEVQWAYYHELFVAHPERTTIAWEDFAARFERAAPGAEVAALVAETVPDPADRLDLLALDRPLDGERHASIDELQRRLVDHVRADVERRTDPAYSADLGAFMGLLLSFGALGKLGATGRFAPRSRVEELGDWWFSFFMYYASGPPPARLRQLLALADVGLVRFLGAGTRIDGDPVTGRFVARSDSHPDVVHGTALVDARIAPASLSRTTDALLRNLRSRGEVVEEVVRDDHGWERNTGKVVVTGPALSLQRADGTAHPRRHGLGVFTNRPAAGAFSRPRTNAPSFRQNDLVARTVLGDAVTAADARRGEHDAEVSA